MMRTRYIAALLVISVCTLWPLTAYCQSVSAKNHFKVGRNHLEHERYEDAEKEFKEALKMDGRYSDAHYLLGLTYYYQKKLDDAQKELEETVRLEPRFEVARIFLASVLLEKKDYVKAREQLQYVITNNQKVAQAHYGLGVISYMEGDIQKSIDSWIKCTTLDKNFAPAFYNLSQALYLQNRTDEAKAELEKALKLKPNSTLYRFSMAWMDYEKGKKSDALKSFEVIQGMAPDLPEGIVSEGILAYEKEDIDRALECADRACQKNLQFRGAYELRALSHEKAGEWDDAVKAYEDMLKLDPNEKDLKKKIDGLSAKIAALQEEKKKRAHYSNHEDDRKIDTTNN